MTSLPSQAMSEGIRIHALRFPHTYLLSRTCLFWEPAQCLRKPGRHYEIVSRRQYKQLIPHLLRLGQSTEFHNILIIHHISLIMPCHFSSFPLISAGTVRISMIVIINGRSRTRAAFLPKRVAVCGTDSFDTLRASFPSWT